MKHYFLNERTESGIITHAHFDSIEEAEFALNELESATEIETFEEEEEQEDGTVKKETIEMEVYSNTSNDFYINNRPTPEYKAEHAEELKKKSVEVECEVEDDETQEGDEETKPCDEE